MRSEKLDLYLVGIILISAIFVVYWVSYSYYMYASFQSHFWDLGQEMYSMYIHLHNPALIGGLQFLAFSNHISIFKLLLLPLFALYQHPMTLVLIQDVAVALCAVVCYLIGRDLIKNRYVGFALGLAFLLNPGVRGVVFFDLHVEAFIPLFFLLAFYCYMREKRICFLASYVLMLTTIETAPFVGLSLLAALPLYELLHVRRETKAEKDGQRRRLMGIAMAFIITAIFMLFYFYTANTLVATYRAGGYSAMPPFLKVMNFLSIQAKAVAQVPGGGVAPGMGLQYMVLWGILVLLFGFGITGLRNPLITLALIAPWVLEVVVLHNVVFSYLYYHYYAYVIAGAAVAAALGFMILKRGALERTSVERRENRLASLAIACSIAISIVLLVGLPSIPNLLPTNWNIRNYTAMNAALMTIPSNAVVMASPSIAAHLYWVLYLELPPTETVGGFSPTGFVDNFNITTYYKVPEYIVFDPHLPDYGLLNETQFNVYSYMAGNYSPYYSSGGILVYRRLNFT